MNQLYARNYKTGEILTLGNQMNQFCYGGNIIELFLPDEENPKIISVQEAVIKTIEELTPIMQKVIEKTGCMVFGDYVVSDINGDISCYLDIEGEGVIGNIFDELTKHYAGQENRLEEFLE